MAKNWQQLVDTAPTRAYQRKANKTLTEKDFTRPYATKSGELIPLQAIGLALSRQTRITAIRFPSNAMRKQKKSATTSWSSRT